MPQASTFTPVERRPLPLPTLIACLTDRIEIAKAHESAGVGVGCIADLIEQTIPHLRRLEQLEARHA